MFVRPVQVNKNNIIIKVKQFFFKLYNTRKLAIVECVLIHLIDVHSRKIATLMFFFSFGVIIMSLVCKYIFKSLFFIIY